MCSSVNKDRLWVFAHFVALQTFQISLTSASETFRVPHFLVKIFPGTFAHTDSKQSFFYSFILSFKLFSFSLSEWISDFRVVGKERSNEMIRFGSGTYNVRDSEVLKDTGRQIQRTIICTVHFLDASQQDFEVDVSNSWFYRHYNGSNLTWRWLQISNFCRYCCCLVSTDKCS